MDPVHGRPHPSHSPDGTPKCATHPQFEFRSILPCFCVALISSKQTKRAKRNVMISIPIWPQPQNPEFAMPTVLRPTGINSAYSSNLADHGALERATFVQIDWLLFGCASSTSRAHDAEFSSPAWAHELDGRRLRHSIFSACSCDPGKVIVLAGPVARLLRAHEVMLGRHADVVQRGCAPLQQHLRGKARRRLLCALTSAALCRPHVMFLYHCSPDSALFRAVPGGSRLL